MEEIDEWANSEASMIDITKLREADKGRFVIYTAHHGEREEGVLSSWNDKNIFVRYGRGSTAAATDPEQLTWSVPFPGADQDQE